jgi:hypothetical protein
MSIDENADSTGLTAKMALCVAAITLVGIDGEFKEDELDKLRRLIQTDETAFLKAFNFYNEHSLDICIKVVSARLNEEQKRTAYRLLVDLAHADRDVAVSEKELLSKYSKSFGLADKFIKKQKNSSLEKIDLAAFK